MNILILNAVAFLAGMPIAPTVRGGENPPAPAAKISAEYQKEVRAMLAECTDKDGLRMLQIARLAAARGLRADCEEALSRALTANVEIHKIEMCADEIVKKDVEGTASAALSLKAQQAFATIGNCNIKDPLLRARVILANATLAQMPAEALKPEIERAIVSPKAAAREAAAGLFDKIGPSANAEPLLRRIFVDPAPEVRQAAVRALAARKDSKIVARLSGAVNESSALSRVHSAEALGEMRMAEAVPALAKRLKALNQAAAGAPYAPANFFYSGTQRAYVAGYQAEVAQASAIAEPIISTLMDGVVLDVRVLGVSSERGIAFEKNVIHNALVKIAGADLGNKPEAWLAWHKSSTAAAPTAAGPAPGGK